jgi:hypothetical protein
LLDLGVLREAEAESLPEPSRKHTPEDEVVCCFLGVDADGQTASLIVSIFSGSRALRDWIRALDRSHAKKHTLDREWFRQTKSWASDRTP